MGREGGGGSLLISDWIICAYEKVVDKPVKNHHKLSSFSANFSPPYLIVAVSTLFNLVPDSGKLIILIIIIHFIS